MAFEEHTNRKVQFGNPYADYEYYGKQSRHTWPGLVFLLLIGAGLCYFGWYRWHEINMAEIMGDTISLTSLEWILYKVGGKWGVGIVLCLLGVFMAWAGVANFRRLEKMK